MSFIVNLFGILLFLLCWFLILKKLMMSRYAPVKTVQAEVIDKYKENTFSKYPGVSKQEVYIVVFAAQDAKFSFAVSELSFQQYNIKEKGTLTYKGNRIISFQ